jgi:hypothetical protein
MTQNKANYEKIDHNIGIKEKRQFFRRKLGKIAENCNYNIDPCSVAQLHTYVCIGR